MPRNGAIHEQFMEKKHSKAYHHTYITVEYLSKINN